MTSTPEKTFALASAAVITVGVSMSEAFCALLDQNTWNKLPYRHINYQKHVVSYRCTNIQDAKFR